MSSPWNPGGQGPDGPPDPFGQRPYGEVQPYGGSPVDPYAGQAAPPVPPYNPYVNPGSWEAAQYFPGGSGRQQPGVPGTLVAGSIVGYVVALFLFVTGLFLVFFGSVIGSIDGTDSTLGDGGVSLVVAGLGNWVAVGLFITGGVMASLRRPAGLIVSIAASGLVVVLAVYWIVLYPDAGIVFWAFVHVLFALIPVGLIVLPPANRAWLAGRAVTGPPRPAGPPPFPTDRYGRPFGS